MFAHHIFWPDRILFYSLPCSGVSGEFMSPNYPNKYPNNVECIWTIMGAPGKVITVSFQHFELELDFQCGYDAVRAYEGEGEDGPEIFE